MDNYSEEYVFEVIFCPVCGTENIQDEKSFKCTNCNNKIAFTINEYNNLAKKYCIKCGNKLKEDDRICSVCRNKLTLEPYVSIYMRATELAQAEKRREAILEAKKMLKYELDSEDKYFIYGLLASNLYVIIDDKYGHLNYLPKELLESDDLKDMLKYCEISLNSFKENSSDFKNYILSNPAMSKGYYYTKKLYEDLPKEIERSKSYLQYKQHKQSGCFIATAAYGSPLSEQVVFFREFRDSILLNNRFGKIFVKYYYIFSPFISKIISKYDLLKSVTKLLLNRLIIIIRWFNSNI